MNEQSIHILRKLEGRENEFFFSSSFQVNTTRWVKTMEREKSSLQQPSSTFARNRAGGKNSKLSRETNKDIRSEKLSISHLVPSVRCGGKRDMKRAWHETWDTFSWRWKWDLSRCWSNKPTPFSTRRFNCFVMTLLLCRNTRHTSSFYAQTEQAARNLNSWKMNFSFSHSHLSIYLTSCLLTLTWKIFRQHYHYSRPEPWGGGKRQTKFAFHYSDDDGCRLEFINFLAKLCQFDSWKKRE